VRERDKRNHGSQMNQRHFVTLTGTDVEFLYLTVGGQHFRQRWSDCSARLAQATNEQRAFIEVSPSGYGLHWPLINEDLAIGPLLDHAQIVNQSS
jgi:hypothetical protein